MDLMEQLRQQAEALKKAQESRKAQHDERLLAVDAAMARIFKYFHEFLKHLDVVKPINPTSYVVPHVGALEGLSFRESFIDHRKTKSYKIEAFDSIHFFIRWGAEPDLRVDSTLPPHAQRVRDALWTCNMRYSEDVVRADGAVQKVVFVIPRTVVTDVDVHADHENSAVVFSTRNLIRLGPEEFRVGVDQCGKETLDDLGRLILGQRSGFARYRTLLVSSQKR